ncbi:FAD/NAD(P)-binding protein [Chachezhania sediminis]|uniref:FAD/NAD(P)-binding protein n=1 Tax=Chachezhania sediminis TaxID=2599291 RepID=UPI00131E5110|nr:FAD/NAD(P)-binding domain-containing protein [Chachezhania sediminis]
MQSQAKSRIAVVGFGPRGLGALEALAARLPHAWHPLAVEIFEPFPARGAGPNFDPAESPFCRLNIPLRDIDIRPPDIGACGSFADWLPGPVDPDVFPPRTEIGRYLEARVRDLCKDKALSLTFHADHVLAAEQVGTGWRMKAGDAWHGPYDEVLLTVGQPKVSPDDQLAEWQAHADETGAALADAYPARDLARRTEDWTGKTVAIRGLALSAFDVLRVLTEAQGGRFVDGVYIPSGREPARILPFSLDGRPPFPKPETEGIDALFEPTEAETGCFQDHIARAAAADPGTARELIGAALLPVLERIWKKAGGAADKAAIEDWLRTEWTDPGTQEIGGPEKILHDGIAMAEGRVPPGIGYTAGQVWRKWQDSLRSGFNPADTAPETAELIIGFDEGLKRYSYGPPVSFSHELAALIRAGIVDPGLSADPGIELVSNGWKLSADGREAVAEVMIDAVLPSPDLSIVTDPLVTGLVSDGRLSPVADGMGARTTADGTVLGTDGTQSRGLTFLGRLALGSVIAADSLQDCFGAAASRWALGVIARIGAPRTGDR